eukprot:3432251-Prymnesium_polylepis.1
MGWHMPHEVSVGCVCEGATSREQGFYKAVARTCVAIGPRKNHKAPPRITRNRPKPCRAKPRHTVRPFFAPSPRRRPR